MMTLDCTGVAPELLHAMLEALAPLEVEHAGQTFPALGCDTCDAETVVFRLTDGATQVVPRDAITRIRIVR
jgi:hypothetical protein